MSDDDDTAPSYMVEAAKRALAEINLLRTEEELCRRLIACDRVYDEVLDLGEDSATADLQAGAVALAVVRLYLENRGIGSRSLGRVQAAISTLADDDYAPRMLTRTKKPGRRRAGWQFEYAKGELAGICMSLAWRGLGREESAVWIHDRMSEDLCTRLAKSIGVETLNGWRNRYGRGFDVRTNASTPERAMDAIRNRSMPESAGRAGFIAALRRVAERAPDPVHYEVCLEDVMERALNLPSL